MIMKQPDIRYNSKKVLIINILHTLKATFAPVH